MIYWAFPLFTRITSEQNLLLMELGLNATQHLSAYSQQQKKSPVSGHRPASKSVRWCAFFCVLPFSFCQHGNTCTWYIAYAGTKFATYKVWWLWEASQTEKMFMPRCEKSRLKHIMAEFQSIQQFWQQLDIVS